MRSLHSPFASEGEAVFLRPRAACIEHGHVTCLFYIFKMLLLWLLLSRVSRVIDSSAVSGERYGIISRKDSRITLVLSQHIASKRIA